MWCIALVLVVILVLAYCFPDKKLNTHFFVTTVHVVNGQWKDVRCWGYSSSFHIAEEAVINNYGDMYEASNQYAVIEEMTATVCTMHPINGIVQWYVWCDCNEQYERCAVPEWAVNVVHWSIG